MKRSEVLKLRKIIEKAAQSLDDETALEAVTLHPEWASGVDYAVGFKVQRGSGSLPSGGWGPGSSAR